MYKGRLEKIGELENGENPNNIIVGDVVEGLFLETPEEGKCFFITNGNKLNGRKTSEIQTITECSYEEFIFETMNSRYRLTYELE